MAIDLLPEERQSLLSLARSTIARGLSHQKAQLPICGRLATLAMGAFVTLKIDGRLRGCIGRMDASLPLSRLIQEMALSAAFEDPRFSPLSKEELPNITIEITLLEAMRPIAHTEEIEVGRHGVLIRNGGRQAVFLPQVATEQGWNRGRLLRELCIKARLPETAWCDPDSQLMVFEGLSFGEED